MADTPSASASSAVVPVPLPIEGRFAPAARQPTPLLCARSTLRVFQSVGTAVLRPANALGYGSLSHRADTP